MRRSTQKTGRYWTSARSIRTGVSFTLLRWAIFLRLLRNEWFGGHNIIAYDLKYLEAAMPQSVSAQYVDTLCLSPLLFPAKPYHRLLKDDKLQTDSLSNPLDDAVKLFELFCDEIILPDIFLEK